MLRNYLIISFRKLVKNKIYTFINVAGLSIGIALCILIFLFIKDESSFDKFHKKAANIFRVNAVTWFSPEQLKAAKDKDSKYTKSAYLPVPLDEALKDNLPGVKETVRISEGTGVVRYGDKIFEEELFFTDKCFFDVFSFKLINGTPGNALNDLNNVVITKNVAQKYFGSENAVGKILQIKLQREEKSFFVSAVAENVPENSSIKFNIVLPFENKPFYEFQKNNWGFFTAPVFLRLKENESLENFKKNLTAFAQKQFSETIEEKRTKDSFGANDKIFDLDVTPLTGIHLDTSTPWYNQSDPAYSYILGGIALLIFCIAAINYITLSLSNSYNRNLEIGIRKVLGARKIQLVSQFLGEAQIIALIAAILSCVIVECILPYFNHFVKKDLSLGFDDYFQLAATILFFSIITGIFAGSYPAFYLSKFQPVKIFKGNSVKVKTGFTKSLIVVQFALSSFLILSAIIMYRQMEFVANKNLGFNKDQVIVIPAYHSETEKGVTLKERLKAELLKEKDILGVSGVSISFGQGSSILDFGNKGKNITAYAYRTDAGFLSMMKIGLMKGRNFSEEMSTDENSIIINETMAKQLGKENPVGEQLFIFDEKTPLTIIGVVKDYHFLSLESNIESMFLYIKDYDPVQSILIKVRQGTLPGAINIIRNVWHNSAPGRPFNYSFLDEDIANQYERYISWKNIMSIATLLALFIACMGLFGLAGITAMNKTKEIGIRKVLGAGISTILFLLNKDIIRLSIISFIIAAPAAYFVMNKWLEDFSYRISIDVDLFFVSAIVGLLVALLTVSYHSIKAALANPVESLKYE